MTINAIFKTEMKDKKLNNYLYNCVNDERNSDPGYFCLMATDTNVTIILWRLHTVCKAARLTSYESLELFIIYIIAFLSMIMIYGSE